MTQDYFPSVNTKNPHIKSDYFIAGFVFYCIICVLVSDSQAISEVQYLWGFVVSVCLAIMLRGESNYVRIQVFIAILLATIGEFFGSVYMEAYLYQLGTIPAYVPPGHGMVYLAAIALGRSGLFQKYARQVAIFVVITGGSWAVWGISGIPKQADISGAILFVIFLLCVWKGRNPMVYLGAFFITTWLELVGTATGVWTWALIDPILGISQGNPPSGVAAYYCLVDAVAIGLAAPLLLGLKKLFSVIVFQRAKNLGGFASLGGL